MEIFCMYHEMQSIVYKTFNFERMYTVLGKLTLDEKDPGEINGAINGEINGGINGEINGNVNGKVNGERDTKQQFKFTGHIPTPEQIAAEEKIFLPPDHLARRGIAFGSPGRSVLDPDELEQLVGDVFRGEKYFLMVGQDVKNQIGLSARVRQWMRRRKGLGGYDPQEHCHIVLHADAK